MNTILTSTRSHRASHLLRRSLPFVKHYLRLTFIRGPKSLLTSRISAKCATVMVAMCTPSLLFCALLTFPAMIFQSPHQNAYFYFSHGLESDPTRWVVLLLAGVCAITSLAVPATMPEPRETELF